MTKTHARSNSLIYMLERTLRQVRHALQSEFVKDEIPITIDQWLLLQQIAIQPGISQQQLAVVTDKDPASVTRSVTLLLKRKLVARVQSKQDARAYTLTVTDAGKKVLTTCHRSVARFRTKATKGISQDSLNMQKRILEILAENCAR
jgi:MarR family transcriptional regulator, transcriptional regulator for hemolysin